MVPAGVEVNEEVVVKGDRGGGDARVVEDGSGTS